MKPLPRENTISEFLRAHIFMIFGICFTVSSRIHILSTFLSHFIGLGIPFWHLGDDFRGSFFQVSKNARERFTLRFWVEAIFDPSGKRGELGGKGPEEAQRRLGVKKLIDVCSQMQQFLFVFPILRGVFEGRYHELSIFTANNDGR